MALLAILTGIGFFWLWWNGYLGRDVTSKLIMLVGLVGSAWLSARGQAIMGAALMGICGVMASKDWVRAKVNEKIVERSLTDVQARAVLEVGPNASRADILAAHRRKIAQVHPDKNPGASSDLASRVNAARDYLLKHLPPEA